MPRKTTRPNISIRPTLRCSTRAARSTTSTAPAPASRQSGRIVVVEGYMDVIALAAAGIADAVAPLGTALTERQIELLWRLVEVPILCFDGDAAGQRAAMRAIDPRPAPAAPRPFARASCACPPGMDPDDLVKRDGQAAMEALLASPGSRCSTRCGSTSAMPSPLNTPEDKAGLKARLMDACRNDRRSRDQVALSPRTARPLLRLRLSPARSAEPASQPGCSARPGEGRPARRSRTRLVRRRASRLRGSLPGGARDSVCCRRCIAGLARHPDEIARHAEALGRLAPRRPATLPPRSIALLERADTLEMARRISHIRRAGRLRSAAG